LPSGERSQDCHEAVTSRSRCPPLRVRTYPPATATKHEAKPTVAPIVGPDDERVFTDSGIEIKPLYDESDV